MALVVKDRVKETTATTGTGTLTLAGAVAGFQTFTSVLSNGDTTYYGIFESSTGEFEVGLGTFTSSGTTLARTTILESSNSGSAINLTAGAADVFITQPAEKAVYLDGSDNVNFDDNSKAIFGAGSDLQIYSDGANSIIHETDGTGNLIVRASNINLQNSGATATLAQFIDGGKSSLRYNNSEKLATTSTGIDVTGAVTADSLTVKSPSVSGEQVIFKIENAANTGTIGQITYNQTDDTMAISNESTGILRFDTTAVERMRIDSSGNVGIGTSSPNSYSNYTTLTLNGTNGAEIDFEQSGTIKADIFTDTSHNLSIRNHGAGAIKFFNNPQTTERMRIDSSGNLLVGRTSTSDTNVGGMIRPDGFVQSTRDGNIAADFNRNTSDGDIVRFSKGSSPVGSIGVNAQRPYIGSSLASTDANIKFTDVQILPCDATGANTDGTDDIGSSSARFKDLYLSSGIKNSGDLTVDVGGDIILDADGGDIIFADGGSYKLSIANSSGDVVFVNNSTDKDFLFKGYDGASLITALTLDMSDAGTATFNNHIVMQENHFINRRFEMDGADTSTTAYILLCVNAPSNDVNGTITMDRTSGLRFACSWDIIVSSGSGLYPIGSLIGHGVAGNGQPSARLVTLTYSSVSYVALELTNPDQYYETTGAYFNGRIVNSGSNTFTVLPSSSVSSISDLTQSNSKAIIGHDLDINGDLNAVDNIYLASTMYHEGDTDTYTQFSTDSFVVVTGGGNRIMVNNTGVRLGDSGNGYFQPVSGDYGSIQIDGGAHNSWEGYSIGGRAVFMHDNSTTSGIYDDVNNSWLFVATHGGASNLYHNGTNRFQTTSSGVNIEGDLNAVDNIYVATNIYHEGDTDTYLGFGTNYINLVTGNSTSATFNSSGIFVNDGSVAEDYDALSGTTPTCNVDYGGAFSLTMSGNTTFTFSGASSGYIQGFVLQLTGNGSTVTWPASVKWAGGTAPDAPASGETDILVFITRDGGTNWYGALAIDAAA